MQVWVLVGMGLLAQAVCMAQVPFAFGDFQQAAYPILQPMAAVYDEQGLLYVAEGGVSRISVLNSAGKTQRTWGRWGTKPGRLRTPAGLVFVGEDLWVADRGNHRIQIFSKRGRLKRVIDRVPLEFSTLFLPTGLAYHSASGRVAIVDSGNRRVVLLALDGQSAKAMVSNGQRDLVDPAGVAFDPDGILYLADRGTNQIARMTKSGEFLEPWGGYGPHFGLLDEPTAAVWHGGSLWVVDRRNHRLQRFGPVSGPETVWGTHEVTPHEGNGTLHYPDILAIAHDGSQAVVGEALEHRLQFFMAAAEDQLQQAVLPNAGIRQRTHFGDYLSVNEGYLVAAEPENHFMFLFDLRQELPVIVNKFGERGSGMGLLNRIEGVCLFPERSEVATLDSVNRRLQFYKINLSRNAPLRFDPSTVGFTWALDYRVFDAVKPGGAPVDLTALRNGPDHDAYLLDRANGQILKCNLESKEVAVFFPKQGPSPFLEVTDFAFDETAGCWWVVDRLAGHIWEISVEGSLLGSLGKRGKRKGRLLQPFGIAVLPQGGFLVTDSLKDEIYHFDQKGKYQNSWGGRGDRMGQFWRPLGIGIDEKSRVFVIDQGNHRAQIFTTEGEWLATFGAGKAYNGRNVPKDKAPLPRR